MNIFLVQHGEAKAKDQDPQRPLSEKGLNDVRRVAAFITKRKNIEVKSILHSGKTRAQQTAELLAEYLNPSNGVEEVEGLEPLADPSIWVSRINETKDDIVLVGHLPHLSRLSSHLLFQDESKDIIDFKMGGIVCLEKEKSGIWLLGWMLIPQILP